MSRIIRHRGLYEWSFTQVWHFVMIIWLRLLAKLIIVRLSALMFAYSYRHPGSMLERSINRYNTTFFIYCAARDFYGHLSVCLYQNKMFPCFKQKIGSFFRDGLSHVNIDSLSVSMCWRMCLLNASRTLAVACKEIVLVCLQNTTGMEQIISERLQSWIKIIKHFSKIMFEVIGAN